MKRRVIIAGVITLTACWMLYALQISKAPASSEKKKGTEKPAADKPAANYGKYEFTYTTLDGKTRRLSDYAGKTVLVNIWAPWCGPCKMETPGFVKMYKEYKDHGFEILSVAVNTNETDVRAFIAKYGVEFPVGIKDDVGRQYGTYGIPDNYLFNPDGSLVKRFIGYTKEDALKPLLEASLKLVAKED